MKALRVLVVDDEPLARRGVIARLRRIEGMTIVGECRNGTEAVAAIQSQRPDLVFLDIQMPELDGFGVVARLQDDRAEMPAIVFVTAFDEFALKAFEAHAVDYLLKPIDDDRFIETTERVRRLVAEKRAHEEMPRMLAAIAAFRQRTPAEPLAPRIAVPDRGRTIFVETGAIDWIEADDDYICLHVGDRSHLLRETMAAIAERLPESIFVRIHRSSIVNISRVRELRARPNREYVVVLQNGTELKLSRGYRDRVSALIGGR